MKVLKHFNSTEKTEKYFVKAIKKLESYEFSEFKFIHEYQESVIKYVEFVFDQILNGISIELGVDPSKIEKSIKINVLDIVKILKSNGEQIGFYKSLFSRLNNKLTISEKFFKKYGFNNGKKLSPIKFKNRIKYDPKTKAPLTIKEWNNITDEIVKFLGDKIGSLEEEMIVKTSLFGKLINSMEKEGIKIEDQKKIDYSNLEKKFGKIPSTIEDAKKKFKLNNEEENQINYSINHAAEYMSIRDGKIKNTVVSSVRSTISEGLKNGYSPQQVASNLYHLDPKDENGKRLKDKTKQDWNRDWRRVAMTEMKMAEQNGYLASKISDDGRKTYLVFSGRYNDKEKPEESCNKWLGTIVLLVKEPLGSDILKNDPYAKRAVWLGKNNIGRGKREWICIPLHPHCTHYWVEIDPSIEEWNSKINKVVFRED